MKEFDLNLAKSGKPVQLRNGLKARIICFDKKDPVKPIVVLRETLDGKECVAFYAPSGKCSATASEYDLVMAQVKRHGWVNLARTERGRVYACEKVHLDIKDASCEANTIAHRYVDTVKIEWEE